MIHSLPSSAISPDSAQGASRRLPPLTGKRASQIKSLLKRMIHSTGFDIKRFRPGREEFLASRRIDTILDVGANIGQFGREIRSAEFQGRIISFEPLSTAYSRLLETSKADRLWTAYQVGISDTHGSAKIHVFKDSTFSSLHEITDSARCFGEETVQIASEEVALCRLEEFDAAISGHRLFLKIDTQGHERQVLEGVGRIFERIHGVQLELPIARLYERSWTIAEGMAFMAERGFVPTHFRPNNFHPNDSIAIVDVDCIFRRADPSID